MKPKKKTTQPSNSELEPLKKEFDKKKIKSERFEFIFREIDNDLRHGKVFITDHKTKEVYKTHYGVNVEKGVDYLGINLLSKKLPNRLQAGIIYEAKERFIAVLELL
jgi:hypothetical protein